MLEYQTSSGKTRDFVSCLLLSSLPHCSSSFTSHKQNNIQQRIKDHSSCQTPRGPTVCSNTLYSVFAHGKIGMEQKNLRWFSGILVRLAEPQDVNGIHQPPQSWNGVSDGLFGQIHGLQPLGKLHLSAWSMGQRGFWPWGYPKMAGFWKEKSDQNLDDFLGVPIFWETPISIAPAQTHRPAGPAVCGWRASIVTRSNSDLAAGKPGNFLQRTPKEQLRDMWHRLWSKCHTHGPWFPADWPWFGTSLHHPKRL